MAEIRLREVSKDLMKKAERVQFILKEKTTTGMIERVLVRFLEDQDTIAALQKRNTELHRAIRVYYDKEDRMKAIIDSAVRETAALHSYYKGMLKHFGNKRAKSKPSKRK